MQFLCQLGSYGTEVHFLLERVEKMFDLEQGMSGCGRSNGKVKTQTEPSIQRAHNTGVAGSDPAPATILFLLLSHCCLCDFRLFLF